MQESQAHGVRHRSGFSIREHKIRMKQQMQQSREKSPTLGEGFQVINYNQYNIYNGPVTNNLVDDLLIKPESPKKVRERRLSVVSQS